MVLNNLFSSAKAGFARSGQDFARLGRGVARLGHGVARSGQDFARLGHGVAVPRRGSYPERAGIMDWTTIKPAVTF